MMNKEGCFPELMSKSVFITLPKVSGTAKCEKHCIISLMSHVTKLVLRVIIIRIQCRTLNEIACTVQLHARLRNNAVFILRISYCVA